MAWFTTFAQVLVLAALTICAARTDNNIFSVTRSIREGEKSGRRVVSLPEELGISNLPREPLRYNFRKSSQFDPNNLFVIENDALQIGQNSPDRERLCSERMCDCQRGPSCRVNFFVDVAKANEDFVWRIFNVTVNIEDVNDQQPAFLLPRYTINVQENDAQVLVELPVATDQDWGTKICKYELRDGEDPASRFNVAKRGEKHYLTVRQPLNREDKDQYIIHLIASECSATGAAPSGSTEILVLVKDVDDTAPYFQQSVYTVNVPEDTVVEVPVSILELRASDADDYSRITYTMQGDPVFLLRTDENEVAHIDLGRPLDFETRSQYNLTLVAHSGAFNASTLITVNVIDANDHAPEIRFFDIQMRAFCSEPNVDECVLIRENLPADTPIAKVQVTDGDASHEFGYVQCAVQSGDEEVLVKLKPTSNVTEKEARFTLLTSRPFDREQETKVRATIACYNVHREEPQAATRTLVIVVGDVNDNVPTWPEQRMRLRVAENNVIGEQIGVVRAYDTDLAENGTVSYRLLPSPDAQLVSIVSNGSFGYVHARTIFDRERRSNVSVQVVAFDSGSPALNSTPLELVFEIDDANDNVPQFENRTYRFAAIENDQVQSEGHSCRPVGKMRAIDADASDAGRLEYSIRSVLGDKRAQVEPNDFRVDSEGTLSVCAPLDRETHSLLTIVVQARDLAQHVTSATVFLEVVDVNDSPPTLRGPTEFDLREDSQAGAIVAQLAAEDRDSDENGRVIFRLAENPDNLFQLDSTGTLKLTRQLTDRDAARGLFRLSIELTNGLHAASTGETMQTGIPHKYLITVRVRERTTGGESIYGEQPAVTNTEKSSSGGNQHFLMIVFLVTIAGTLCIIVLLVVVFLKRDSLFKSAYAGPKVDEEAARSGDEADDLSERHYASAGSLEGSDATYGELKAAALGDTRPPSSCSERLKNASTMNRTAIYTSYEPVMTGNNGIDQSYRKQRTPSQFAAEQSMHRSRSFTSRVAQRSGSVLTGTATFAMPAGYMGAQTPTMTVRKPRQANLELVSVHNNAAATATRGFKSSFVSNNNDGSVMVCEKCDCPECNVDFSQPLSLTEASSQQVSVLPCFGAPLGAPCMPFGPADVYNTSQYCDYYTAERSMLRKYDDQDRNGLQKEADANGNALTYRDANADVVPQNGTGKARQLVLLNSTSGTPQTKAVSGAACSTNLNSVATMLPDTPKLGAKSLRSIYNEASNV